MTRAPEIDDAATLKDLNCKCNSFAIRLAKSGEDGMRGQTDPMAQVLETVDFGHAERLLITTWRKIVVGQGDCPLVVREFSIRCGEMAGEVLATVFTFIRALGHASRQRLRVGYPGCAGLTGDERQLLALIAGSQHDHHALFDAHIRWLAREEGRGIAIIAAIALGTALLAHGLRLEVPAACGFRAPGIPNEPGYRASPLLQLILNCHNVVAS